MQDSFRLLLSGFSLTRFTKAGKAGSITEIFPEVARQRDT